MSTEKLLQEKVRIQIKELLERHPGKKFTYSEIFDAVCLNFNGLRSFSVKKREGLCRSLIDNEFKNYLKVEVPVVVPEVKDQQDASSRKRTAERSDERRQKRRAAEAAEYTELQDSWQKSRKALSGEYCVELNMYKR